MSLPPPAPRRRAFQAALALYVLVAVAVAAISIRGVLQHRAAAPRYVSTGIAGDDVEAPQSPLLALDPVVGIRPRRNYEQNFVMHALHSPGSGGGKDRITRRTNNLALVRPTDVTELAPGARVLLVGDSHLMGVVNAPDNAAARLESMLLKGGFPQAAVYNASCGFYSLWQDVLRVRQMAETLAPDALVVVVFLGNDFVELEDLGRPHLDDALTEQPADPKPPAETTSARMRRLALPEEPLFWQGLDQAAYFAEHPERFEPVCAKARRCLEALRDEAQRRAIPALVALLPSYDLVFPDRVAAVNDAARAAAAAGANGRFRERMVALTAELGLPAVDVLDSFRAWGREDLYATDYHIFVKGHELLATRIGAALEAPLLESLRRHEHDRR